MSQSMTELEQLRSHCKALEDLAAKARAEHETVRKSLEDSAAKALAEHEAQCQSLKDSADKARSELEGISLIPRRSCSFILRVDDSELLQIFE